MDNGESYGHSGGVVASSMERGATRTHLRVRYRFPRVRECALRALVTFGSLLFMVQLATTSEAVFSLLSGVILITAAACSVLLFANNLRWVNAKHAVLSFPFVTSVGASAVNIIAEWVAARGIGAGVTLLLSISVPMVHLCCVVVYRRLVLGILLLGLSSSTALVVTASLFAEDEDLFSVGEVTYTYLSVRRSCIATLWTTTVVLLMSSVQKRNGPHAHLLVPVSALQHEPWLEDAVGLPAWSLTRARAAVMVARDQTLVADAAAMSASCGACPRYAPPFVRALIAVQVEMVAGGRQQPEAPNRVEASWQVVRALHRFVHMRNGEATLAMPALEEKKKGLEYRVKLVIIGGVVVGVCLYFVVYFIPDCAGAVLAPVVPMCAIGLSWLIFRGRTSRRQLRRAAQQPTSWIVWAWLALLTANNLYRFTVWVARNEPCHMVRLASNVVSLDTMITAFLLVPALRVRSPRLEAAIALVCLTTQLFLAVGWSLFSPTTFYRISLPGGAFLDEQDVLRNCFSQLALSLSRVLAFGLMSGTRLQSPLRKRATHRAGQRAAPLNRA